MYMRALSLRPALRVARVLVIVALAGTLFFPARRSASAPAWLVIPSSGTVVTLFLDPNLAENWFHGYYTSTLTWAPVPGNRSAHSGLDIAAQGPDCTAPVYPGLGGTVIWAHYSGLGLGYEVLVEHSLTHRKATLYTMYTGMSTHMDSGTPCFPVTEGHYYGPRSQIGAQASSGRRTGPRVEWTLLLGPGLSSSYDKGGHGTNPLLFTNIFNPVSPSAYSCTGGTDFPGGRLLGRWVDWGLTRPHC